MIRAAVGETCGCKNLVLSESSAVLFSSRRQCSDH